MPLPTVTLSKSHQKDLDELTKAHLLPSKKYFSADNFTKKMSDPNDFYAGVSGIALVPIFNGIASIYYAGRTIYSTLAAIANLLVLKPKDALTSLQDACFSLSLTISLAVMAPINALVNTVSLLSRTIASWFAGKEFVNDLNQSGVVDRFKRGAYSYDGDDMLPASSTFFRKSRFLKPYDGALDCLLQAGMPLISPVLTGFLSLSEAAAGVSKALDALVNLVIGQPKHALDDLKDVSVHFGLALSLAVMTPLNALVEGIAFLSRLGSTWKEACTRPAAPNREMPEEFDDASLTAYEGPDFNNADPESTGYAYRQ